MRVNLFSLFFCAIVMRGWAVDLIYPLYPNWSYSYESRIAEQDDSSDAFYQYWSVTKAGDLTWGQIYDLIGQRIYFKWLGMNGTPVYVRAEWNGGTGYDPYYSPFSGRPGSTSVSSGEGFQEPHIYKEIEGSYVINTGMQISVSGKFTWNKVEQSYPECTTSSRNNPAWTNIDVGNCVITIQTPEQEPTYGCYYAVQGVAFFDGQEGKSVTFVLSSPDNMWANEIFTVTTSGSFYKKSVYHDLMGQDNIKFTERYKWSVYGAAQSNVLGTWETSLSNPDGYIYTIDCDYTLLNTNAPYVPPNPTNEIPPLPPDPTNQPPITNWPSPPVPPIPTPWPPYPPYPDPTNNPPAPEPPAPDTNTPPMPDPNPDPGQTGGPSYATIYSAMRHALRDEGEAYEGPNPGSYDIDASSSNMVMQAFGYGSNVMKSVVVYASNTDLIYGRGAGVLLNAGSVLQSALPVSIGRVDHFVLPWFDDPEGIYVDLQKYANIIRIWREFCLWFLWLTTYFCIFHIVCRTFGRVG